jgi:hypothetical protein
MDANQDRFPFLSVVWWFRAPDIREFHLTIGIFCLQLRVITAATGLPPEIRITLGFCASHPAAVANLKIF